MVQDHHGGPRAAPQIAESETCHLDGVLGVRLGRRGHARSFPRGRPGRMRPLLYTTARAGDLRFSAVMGRSESYATGHFRRRSGRTPTDQDHRAWTRRPSTRDSCRSILITRRPAPEAWLPATRWREAALDRDVFEIADLLRATGLYPAWRSLRIRLARAARPAHARSASRRCRLVRVLASLLPCFRSWSGRSAASIESTVLGATNSNRVGRNGDEQNSTDDRCRSLHDARSRRRWVGSRKGADQSPHAGWSGRRAHAGIRHREHAPRVRVIRYPG